MQMKWMLVWAAVLGVSAADSLIPDDSPVCLQPASSSNFTLANFVGKKQYMRYYRNSGRRDTRIDGVTFDFEQAGQNTYNVTTTEIVATEDEVNEREVLHQWKEDPSKHELFLREGDHANIYSIPYFDSNSSVFYFCSNLGDGGRRHFVHVFTTSLEVDPTKALEEAKKIPIAGEYLEMPYQHSSDYDG